MTDFTWTQHPEAEALVNELSNAAVAQSPWLASLDQRLRQDTSTVLGDWLDHVGGPVDAETLAALGFVEGHLTTPGVWRHPGAQLPAIVPMKDRFIALRVDDVVAFGHAQG